MSDKEEALILLQKVHNLEDYTRKTTEIVERLAESIALSSNRLAGLETAINTLKTHSMGTGPTQR
jgi:hypothetical protein